LDKGRIIGGLTYGALQDAFADELGGVLADESRSVWVLVPTNLLALHLRRHAAGRLGGVIGVDFPTLKDAARRMALISLAADERRPMPVGAAELVLQRLLEDVPEGSYLSAFRTFSNGAPAIAGAIRVLADCLWTPEALTDAADTAGKRDPAAPRRLRELAGMWAELRAWKDENGFFDDGDLVRTAGHAGHGPAEPPDALFIYGFYDFNPAQQSLVARLISLADRCSAYLLWNEEGGQPAPGFEYALPAVDWLQDMLNTDTVECLAPPSGGSDRERLVAGMFGDHPVVPEEEARARLEAAAAASDGSVRVVNCPGELPEAEAVVREMLCSANDAGNTCSVGVLLRGAAGTTELLAEACERAGVRAYIREGLSLADTPAGRLALSLLELAGGEVERSAVVDFLALARVDWPAGLSSSAMNRVARQAGIIKGRSDWQGRLRTRAERLTREARRAEDDAERRACEREAETCRAAAGFVADLFAKIAPLSSPSSWRDVTRHLGALVRMYSLADDPGTAPVLELVDELDRLDLAGGRPGLARVRWALSRRLAQQSLKCERFQHVASAVSSIMAARGATFDVVVVPGLVEREFPRHAPRHSLLTELDREVLNGVASQLGCGELPLERVRPLEERYLFRIALGSATRVLMLTYHRLEQDSGRPKIPSRFLTEACSALAGCGVGGELVDSDSRGGLISRVPLGRAPGDADLALDMLEYDSAVFSGPTGLAGRTAYMAAVSESFRRAAEMDRARWRQNDFGPYDGKIRAPDLLERLRARYSRFGSAISPTRFEAYARCPFEYFLTHVLGIEEVEAPSEEFQLPPLERGSLVHDMLRHAYEEHLEGRPLGGMSDEQIDAIVARSAKVLDELGRVHAENHPATWRVERERTTDELRTLLVHERERHADAVPSRFEYEFGMAAPTPFVLSLGAEAAVAFRGRIDRVDSLPGSAIQIVDYKTGSPGKYKPNRFVGGLQVQLPIYLLAACQLIGAEDGTALYLMTSGPRDVPEFTMAELRGRIDDFRKILLLIVDGIASGDFFPLPAGGSDAQHACSEYCRYRVVCGVARRNLAEMKQTDPDASRLAELRAID
jgi:RecB family exonuclease